jgi:hypothetical protein
MILLMRSRRSQVKLLLHEFSHIFKITEEEFFLKLDTISSPLPLKYNRGPFKQTKGSQQPPYLVCVRWDHIECKEVK